MPYSITFNKILFVFTSKQKVSRKFKVAHVSCVGQKPATAVLTKFETDKNRDKFLLIALPMRVTTPHVLRGTECYACFQWDVQNSIYSLSGYNLTNKKTEMERRYLSYAVNYTDTNCIVSIHII